MKLQDISIHFTSTCDDMKHKTAIIDLSSISNVVGLLEV